MGSFTVPPYRALWLPDNARARVSNRSPVAVRSLYLASSLGVLADAARAVSVPRFCRELLLHVVRCCPLDLREPIDSALVTVLVDQLQHLPDAALWLPHPRDLRAADFVAAAAAHPGTSSDDLARRGGTSRRTLERIFAAETGLSLGAWRRRAHILDSPNSSRPAPRSPVPRSPPDTPRHPPTSQPSNANSESPRDSSSGNSPNLGLRRSTIADDVPGPIVQHQ